MAAVIKETAFGGCPHDCPDTCAMVFDIEDGKVTGVRGNKDHPNDPWRALRQIKRLRKTTLSS